MEWVFFMIELTTIAVYYYTWNRIPEKLHLKVGWVYAGASAATLIIINGILDIHADAGRHMDWRRRNGRTKPANSGMHFSIQPTGRAFCCALAFALRWPGYGRWSPRAASMATSSRNSRPAWCKWSVKWLVPSFVAMPFLMIWYLRNGSCFAARVAHPWHRHHQLGHVLDGHSYGTDYHCDVGDDHLRCVLSWLSQSEGIQSFACDGGSRFSRSWPRVPANIHAKCCASPL